MSDYGELVEPATIRIERLLPGPIDRVWAYLTDIDKRARWLAGGLFEQHTGGRVEHAFRIHELTGEGDAAEPAHLVHGAVLEWDPPHRLRHTWSSDGHLVDSEVSYTLEPEADAVRLTLVHSKLPSRAEMVGVATGWHTHLDLLRARLRENAVEPFWPKFTALQQEYESRLV